MKLSKSWIVTMKDLSIFRKNRYIFYSLIAMPVVFGIVLPSLLLFILPMEIPSSQPDLLLKTVTTTINLTSGYFVVIAAVLPTIIASYSFVGEKVERSLEPLLATPTTDSELLLGKALASFLPCIAAAYIGAAIFIVMVDVWSIASFGLVLLPTVYFALLLGVLTPLTCILSVEANVIISSRVNDIRAAQQLGGLVVVPFILIIILASTTAGLIDPVLLALILSGVIGALDLVMFYLSKATFQREEILTKWK
jgi:ABC-2 type transport system permease protein